MPRPPAARDRIINFLRDNGAKTGAAIREELGMSQTTFWYALNPLLTSKPRRAYIADWEHQEPGVRGRLKPIYKLGCKKDAPKPPTDVTAAHARYRERHRLLLRLRDNKRRGVQLNPFYQLTMPCRSTPTKQQSAKA